MSTIYKPQDMQISDSTLWQQYVNYMESGDVANALATYNNNAQLKGKSMHADMFNQMLNAILALENNYNTNVTQYLQTKLSQRQTSINNLRYKNTFNATIQYEIMNYVLYGESIYFCVGNDGVKPPIGTLPTDTDYWVYLGLKGETGSPNLGVDYKGTWNSLTSYAAYDMVKYQEDLYVAKQASTGQTPSTATTYWFKGVDIVPAEILVSDTEPSSATVGLILFKTL